MQICQHFLYFKSNSCQIEKMLFQKMLEFPINKEESLQLRSSKDLIVICKLITNKSSMAGWHHWYGIMDGL